MSYVGWESMLTLAIVAAAGVYLARRAVRSARRVDRAGRRTQAPDATRPTQLRRLDGDERQTHRDGERR